MEKTRLELLQDNLRTNPDATFVRYALAMELANSGEPEEAWRHFEYLLEHHAAYSATYYHAGRLLVNLGRRAEAREVLKKGVEVTGSQGNLHAQTELQAALEELDK
jgi:tetratricopeptide (TPR) repeat protein